MNLDLKILNSYYLEFVHNFVVEIRILQVAVQKAPDAKRPKCMDAGVPAVIAVVTNPMHLGKATDGLYGQTLLKTKEAG